VLVTVAAAISAMYVAGMFLNDAFDRNIDARERPERPIPSGEIAADTVIVIGMSLLVVGVVALASINGRSGLSGLALAGAILLYDWQHKGNPVAPFVMGLCRALVYVAAAYATAASIGEGVLLPAAALLAYIAGVTYTARLENVDRIGSFWPLALLAAPLVVSLAGSDFSPTAIIALIALAICGLRLAQLLQRRGPGDVSAAVGLLLACISLNDALISSTTVVPYAPLACLACFALTLVLQRYIPAS
jgi:4-hydroxybenzoate polyprenyltransferase